MSRLMENTLTTEYDILLHAHQILQMGSAAPEVFRHVWSHMWQTLHQDFSCLAAETESQRFTQKEQKREILNKSVYDYFSLTQFVNLDAFYFVISVGGSRG